MYGFKAGGYAATTTGANEDIMPAIKVAEEAVTDALDLKELRDISIVPTSGDCNIKIDDGTQIFCKQDIGYANDVAVHKLEIVESGTAFYIAYNY